LAAGKEEGFHPGTPSLNSSCEETEGLSPGLQKRKREGGKGATLAWIYFLKNFTIHPDSTGREKSTDTASGPLFLPGYLPRSIKKG